MRNSYSQILRSLALIGGSSAINIIIGLIRTKVAAIVLGPIGMGHIGVYQSLLGTAASVFSLGLGTAGTRKIAEAASNNASGKVEIVAYAMRLGGFFLSIIGCAVIYIFRTEISNILLGDASHRTQIGWIAVGVGFTIYGGTQTAYLNGLRRIPDLAKISIYSALLCTVAAIVSLLTLKENGIALFVLSTPIALFICGYWFTRKLVPIRAELINSSALIEQWKILSKLGAAFMVSGLAGSVSQLTVRTIISRELGTESVGQFQAAWTIGMTYIGFVLSAMGTDFYPRLASVMSNHVAANRLINQQAEVALLVSGPLFLLLMAYTPMLVHLLYSVEFGEASHLLRWQILGDILKVISWPLGFIMLASGHGRAFMFTEVSVNSVFVVLLWIGLPWFGLVAVAIAFVGMYASLLPIVYFFARIRTKFRWEPRVALHAAGLLFYSSVSFALSLWSENATSIISSIGALIFGMYGISRLIDMVEVPSPIGRMIRAIRKIRG